MKILIKKIMIWASIFLLISNFSQIFIIQDTTAQEPCNGIPIVTKSCSPTSVESGEPVTVTISITGCSGRVTEPIPCDVVLLIDMSGSMEDNDPDDKRLDAAINFSKCAADETRIAIVTFEEEVKLEQELTNDRRDLLIRLNLLRTYPLGDYTNMYDGMVMAQNHLINYSSESVKKYIILLTDGDDNSGHSYNDFSNMIGEAEDHGIIYYTIALGEDANDLLLGPIAYSTGGLFFDSPTADNLEDTYQDICEKLSYWADTTNIILNEELNDCVEVVPGSLAIDRSILIDPYQEFNFYHERKIEIDFGTIKSGEIGTFQFDVYSDCLNPDSNEKEINVNINSPNSNVTYTFGATQGSVLLPQLSYVCWRPGDLRIGKEYNMTTSVLNITLESRYLNGSGDNIIKDIRVIEHPSIYFQPNILSASPSASYIFPADESDVLVWYVPTLAPEEIKTLSVTLESTVCSGYRYHPPITVNAEKTTGGGPGWVLYIRPNGTINKIYLPSKPVSLPNVETCDGRPDIGIQPAYTFGEYTNPPSVRTFSVLAEDESFDIWVDSQEPNGFWDRESENVEDFIEGAALTGEGVISTPDERIEVDGQGDLLNFTTYNYLYVNIKNHGQVDYEEVGEGATLFLFNYSNSRWNRFALAPIPLIESTKEKLIKFKLRPTELSGSFMKPYALPLDDVINIIKSLDRNLGNQLMDWLRTRRPMQQPIFDSDEILPSDILDRLPDDNPWWDPFRWFSSSPLDQFRGFMRRYESQLAWGKYAVWVKVILESPASEKHTNNNQATEIIIISPQP